MSAIEKAAAMLREEAEAIKASHTLRGDWCGDPTEADYHEMIAAADAAIAERDALRAKIEQMEKQRDGLLGALRVIAARPARDEGRNNWEAIVWESISFAEEAIALCDEPDVHPAPSVPYGWKLVPIEPTEEMMMRDSSCQKHAHDDQSCVHRTNRRWIWETMLAAAPEAKRDAP